MRFLSAAFVCLFAITTFADINEDYEVLKDSGTDFEVIGVVCEQVARLELYEVYPSDKYEVVTGIAYSDGKRVLGELDVVVFDRSNRKAELVGEVKCWRNLYGAQRKAREQRQRFLKYINSTATIYFKSTTTQDKYSQDQFEGIKNFISISQKGGEEAGFTESLDYSLEELMGLRKRIMSCQKRHECLAPTH